MISTENDKLLNKIELNILPHPKIRPIRKYKVQLNRSNLQKQIAKNHISQIWEYKPYHLEDPTKELRKLSRALKTSKACRKLNLGLEKWRNVSNKDMGFISQGLKRLVSLENLRFIFYMCGGISDQGLEVLSQGVKELSSLKSIDFRLLHLRETTDGSVKSLSQAFKGLICLKKIVLYVNQSINGSPGSVAMEYLNQGLKRLDTLEKISFDLDCLRRVSENSLQNLTQCLQRCPILKNLQLMISDFPEGGFGIFTECIGKLGALEILNVNVSMSKIDDQDIQNLGEALKKLENLSDFHLNLSGCRAISNEGLRVLSQSLQQMVSLNKISLSAESNNLITSDGLHHIARALYRMSHISLNFSCSGAIRNTGVENLMQGLKEASSLQFLDLSFGICSWLNDIGLEAIIDGLHDLVALKTLNLLLGSYAITAKGFRNLGKSLEKLVLLQNLKLHFAISQHFGDAEFKQIGEGLKVCHALQNLHLDFSNSKNLKDEGLKSLAEGLNGLGNLRTLFLSLYGCHIITDEGVEILAKSLRGMSGLEDLEINLDSQFNQLTHQAIKTWLKNLEQLDCLKNLVLLTKDCIEWDEYIPLAQALKRKFPNASIRIQPWMSFKLPIIA